MVVPHRVSIAGLPSFGKSLNFLRDNPKWGVPARIEGVRPQVHASEPRILLDES